MSLQTMRSFKEWKYSNESNLFSENNSWICQLGYGIIDDFFKYVIPVQTDLD